MTLTGVTGSDIASSWVLHWLRRRQASWQATEKDRRDLRLHLAQPAKNRQDPRATHLRSAERLAEAVQVALGLVMSAQDDALDFQGTQTLLQEVLSSTGPHPSTISRARFQAEPTVPRLLG